MISATKAVSIDRSDHGNSYKVKLRIKNTMLEMPTRDTIVNIKI